MQHVNHIACANACRDERGADTKKCGNSAHDIRAFTRYADPYQITEPFSHDNILGYHRHLRDVIQANAATFERRLSTLSVEFCKKLTQLLVTSVKVV